MLCRSVIDVSGRRVADERRYVGAYRYTLFRVIGNQCLQYAVTTARRDRCCADTPFGFTVFRTKPISGEILLTSHARVI